MRPYYSDFEALVSDDDLSRLSDLCEPTETFECPFCHQSFVADADMGSHYRFYGCQCVPEAVTDELEAYGLSHKTLRTWRIEHRPGDKYALILNGKPHVCQLSLYSFYKEFDRTYTVGEA